MQPQNSTLPHLYSFAVQRYALRLIHPISLFCIEENETVRTILLGSRCEAHTYSVKERLANVHLYTGGVQGATQMVRR